MDKGDKGHSCGGIRKRIYKNLRSKFGHRYNKSTWKRIWEYDVRLAMEVSRRKESTPPIIGTAKQTQGFGGWLKHPDKQHWTGFSSSPSSNGIADGDSEDVIAENIFDWWISGKSYTKWYAEKFLQLKLFNDNEETETIH